MNHFIKTQTERNLEISRELRELAAETPRSMQSVMLSAATALEFISGYADGLERKLENSDSGNFFKTLSKEEKEILSTALLEYRSHTGKVLDSYYKTEEFTNELRERAVESVLVVDKLNEWLAEIYGEEKK